MVGLATFRPDPFTFDSAFNPPHRCARAQDLDGPSMLYGVRLLQQPDLGGQEHVRPVAGSCRDVHGVAKLCIDVRSVACRSLPGNRTERNVDSGVVFVRCQGLCGLSRLCRKPLGHELHNPGRIKDSIRCHRVGHPVGAFSVDGVGLSNLDSPVAA